MRRRRSGDRGQADLFSVDPAGMLPERLDALSWPAQDRFPVNRRSAHVRPVVWSDLVGSSHPLIVAGYSSIGELVGLVGDWLVRSHAGRLRVVLGTEPFGSARRSFGAPDVAFTKEVEEFWLERGISLRLSTRVLQVIEALDVGKVAVRYVHGISPLHAKVYVGEDAATIGSSNFTGSGLGMQIEGNARFDRSSEGQRYEELAQIGDNLWAIGQAWDSEFRTLLEQLLRVVTWKEALARACAELLEGEWAERYLSGQRTAGGELWPSQRIGIAQAMWIIENVGSVLVADATGSGKTRMGAHLVRAVRDRLWATGRVRRDLTVLVCPPSVEETWRDEAVACGLNIATVSHGKLSRSASEDPKLEQREVRQAQLLAVDEAHNFLNSKSKRTRYLRDNFADHVMLFTATPISRGPADLLDLVSLLGPDNFDDATLDILNQLNRRGAMTVYLAPAAVEELRREIQRFTLRRTKTQINRLVDREPGPYLHPIAERTCRYPEHHTHAYETGETESDIAAAETIRAHTRQLRGVALLTRIAVPASLRSYFTDEAWLRFRLRSASGLAAHQVLAALRSSRAALCEHLLGSTDAINHYGLIGGFKATDSGDLLGRLDVLARQGPPTTELACEPPDWLTDQRAWQQACAEEIWHYQAILDQLSRVSSKREETKAQLLVNLAERHDKVLAFDHHLITLAVLKPMLADCGAEILIATGQSNSERTKVQKTFAPTATGRAVALCSDAMNEGLNLQGAAAIVHLDLPTTLRVAEQRVGRVDRMDSPHDVIEAWWPRDGAAFATRANERLAQRVAESETLLGSNLPIPDLGVVGPARLEAVAEDVVVSLEEVQRELEEAQVVPWDGIGDALDAVRKLVEGSTAIIPAAVYDQYRTTSSRVMARVAPLRSSAPWAFLAVRSSTRGAPRWMLIEPNRKLPVVTDLATISDRLRHHLDGDPPNCPLNGSATSWLDECLTIATRSEHQLMPRRMQRALGQMDEVLRAWSGRCQEEGDEVAAGRWIALAQIARPSDHDDVPDPYSVAERWLELVSPVMEAQRADTRRLRYVLIRDITKRLEATRFPLEQVESTFSGIEITIPLAERVSACILGVPETP